MRIANHDGRLTMLTRHGAIDVARASDGLFDHRIEAIYDRWDEFVDWSRTCESDAPGHREHSIATVGPISPRPRQIFGIGLNYVDHAREAGSPLPEVPLIFTKFPSSIAGPDAVVELSGPSVDWEVELVVVIGREASNVSGSDAWSHVAGLTVGQDVSDRDVQLQGKTAQFSFGKSFANFAPIGPALVTPDEFDDPNELTLKCWIGDELMQDGTSSDLVFSVAELIEYISAKVTLFPGDLIFTGTPAGVGLGRTPQRYLADGDIITSEISGIGTMTNKVTAPQRATSRPAVDVGAL
ncbi:fumarylacetoacetate hydrolase family protein [Rhodococcoides fascians]|uniref:fumarylacetoacetate hydrolase family protein n=1 Tax=Rhodococcoides fascians TaxID=1828 RepID=UPI00056D0BAD|nr:fumarylacetoacetate hydrolase family protein [Rhodococcus fascians]